MSVLTRTVMLLALLVAAACGEPPSQVPTPTPPIPAPAPVADPAPTNESIARADALLEDFKRREAAQAKFDRENPPPKFVPIPRTLIDAAKASAASTASAAAAAPPPPERDELWWKGQMQSLQLALDEELARLAVAEKANLKYGYNDAQAEYQKRVAAVAHARQAIQQLRDEARRAGVPPGWLR